MPAQTIQKRHRRAFAANSTLTTLATIAPTTTRPTRLGFHELDAISGKVDSFMIVQPYGSAAQNKDFYLKVTRWTIDYVSGTAVYVPSTPYIVSCVTGNIAMPTAIYGATNFLCDTITLIRGDATAKIVSPQNDEPAEFWLDLGGAEFVEFEIDADAAGTTVVDANALWRTSS